ncbi:hypothetical protein G6L37_06145 [Agrobacterium rubi]|nr:hypothetical protein [Agrobacterium rubi]NTF24942.1 hypothetical protein [Agrobacterium rubi]
MDSALIDGVKNALKALFAVVLFISLFGSGLSMLFLLSPTGEEAEARRILDAQKKEMSFDVRGCLMTLGPWRCFLQLDAKDVADPVKGLARTAVLAEIVTAKQVIAACTEQRRVDCADRMFGKGYSNEDILAAIGE